MRYLSNKILMGLILVVWFGCEEPIHHDLKPDNKERLVVDAIITNEYKQQAITLSYSNNKLNEPNTPVLGATVYVRVKDSIFVFNEKEDSSGIYLSKPFVGVVGLLHELTIIHDSVFYNASATGVSVTALKDLKIVKFDSLYQYTHIEEDQAAMIEVRYDWTSNPDHCRGTQSCKAQETYYTITTIDAAETLAPEKEKILFPPNTKINRTKYSLSAHHEEYLRSLLIETEWRGGLFDVQQGNIKSNISHGALGLFAVCMVTKDSAIIE